MADLKVTGEGFVGEKALTIFAVALSIVSTILLIQLTMMQRQHLKGELAKQLAEKKKKEFNKEE